MVRSAWEEEMAEKEVEGAWGDGQEVAKESKEKAKARVDWGTSKTWPKTPEGHCFPNVAPSTLAPNQQPFKNQTTPNSPFYLFLCRD